ncbi:MAG: anion permease, partial [Gaiellales bacterium]
PLAIGPLVAGLAAAALYPVATMAGRRFGAARDRCVCVGGELVAGASASGAVSVASQLSVTTGTAEQCEARYQGLAVGVSTRRGVDLAHFASAGAVSFARGVNDTPKMVALILAAAAAGSSVSIPVLGVAIALGGLLAARRVASTMGRRITALSPEHGLIANLVSAGLVIGASRYALPVSTTHVTSGGLFGVGAASRQAGWRTIVTIVVAWLTTLPLAAALAGISYLALTA